MTWIDTNTLIAICTCAIGATQFLLWRYIARNKSYESEKGKNIATKEDIEEITKKIESVKNEISFVKQRENKYLEERKECLLNFLNEIILYSIYGNKIEMFIHNCGISNDILRFYEEYSVSFSRLMQIKQRLAIFFPNKVHEEINEICKDVIDYANILYLIIYRLEILTQKVEFNMKYPNQSETEKIDRKINDLYDKLKSESTKESRKKYEKACQSCSSLICVLFELNFHQKISFLNYEPD